jgi:hypothetical protein
MPMALSPQEPVAHVLTILGLSSASDLGDRSRLVQGLASLTCPIVALGADPRPRRQRRHHWELVEKAHGEGGNATAQVFSRPIVLMPGLELTMNPFTLCPAYREIADLPLPKRVARMRTPQVRAKILADPPTDATSNPPFHLGRAWEWIFPNGDG